jgi:hypothetical protein
MRKAGLAVSFLGVAIPDAVRLAARSFIPFYEE